MTLRPRHPKRSCLPYRSDNAAQQRRIDRGADAKCRVAHLYLDGVRPHGLETGKSFIVSGCLQALNRTSCEGYSPPSKELRAGFTKSRTRISVSRGHPFQKVRDSDFSKSRTEVAADLDRFS